MSKPFTAPAGQTWQTLLTKLTTAYSERRQVIGQSAYVPADRKVQLAAYWAGLQGWLESNCMSFINHANGPLTDAGDAFLYFTLESWRAAAGLNANGFRRSPLAGGTAYGRMQAGDAIGGWIFEELQKGFGALRWTLSPLTYTINYSKTRHGKGDRVDKEEAKTNAWNDFISNFEYVGNPPGIHYQLYSFEESWWDADVDQTVAIITYNTEGYSESILELLDSDNQEVCLWIQAYGKPEYNKWVTYGNDYIEGYNIISSTPGLQFPKILLTAPSWPDGTTIKQHGFDLDSLKSKGLIKWNFTQY